MVELELNGDGVKYKSSMHTSKKFTVIVLASYVNLSVRWALLWPSIQEYKPTIEYGHIINISSMYLFIIEIMKSNSSFSVDDLINSWILAISSQMFLSRISQ